MRYRESRESEYQNIGSLSLRAWLRKAFSSRRRNKRNRENINELHRLSDHLLDDLGFDGEANPLSWSSSSEGTTSTVAEKPGKGRSTCRHHCHCRNAVGSLG